MIRDNSFVCFETSINAMHVLFITSGPMVVASEPYANVFQYEQAKAMANDGHTVGVISVGFITLRYLFRRYSYHKIESFDNLNIFRLYVRSLSLERFSPVSSSANRYVELFSEVYESYKDLHGLPDVIYAHNFLYAGLMANYAREKDGVPYGLTEHSSAFLREMIPHSFNSSLLNVALNAKFLTCVSSRLKSALEFRLGVEFGILPNMVDGRFLEVPLSRNPDLMKFSFISVGTLDANKNHSLLINAFASRFKDKLICLKIVGGGPLLRELMILAHSLGVDKQVIFTGTLSRENVCIALSESNCYVSASNHETFGVALVEAIACGLPVISTSSGGPIDIVNENNGLLVDVGSDVQMGEAMNYIMTNYSNYDPFRLRSEVLNKYSYLAFSKRLYTLLHRAIEE